jgi:CubicO group peptidase (beta-lactamase class C family)/D-alanyl-D-alanine dipeptidase
VLLALVFPLARAEGGDVPSKKYKAVIEALDGWLGREIVAKQIPGLSIVLVDDQELIWGKGFGMADPREKTLTGVQTVYRAGSVSKPVTALALMRLVEAGKIDLDAPVTTYLPDFKPANPFDRKITLRQLLSHRAGLVRESPVGNYFDPSNLSLADMVKSLNKTELLYRPQTRTSYSNAGFATVGYLLETMHKEPFAKYMKRTLLDPLGMKNSGFESTAELKKNLAAATMWTYHGREFPAPTFELGMPPAGGLYTTVEDLGRLLTFLFADSKGGKAPLLKKATLEQMWTPQFVKKGEKTGFGLGFFVSEFEGRKIIGHAGAIYGFATEVAALPGDKLGVVVMASKDCANAVTHHVAEVALKQMLAARAGKPLPKIEESSLLKPEVAHKLAGRYRAGDKTLELYERAGNLWLLPAKRSLKVALRGQGDDLIVDDCLDYGLKIQPKGENLLINKDTYKRVPAVKPAAVPAKWAGLIGEYGWDHNTLYILERDGKLHALIEWFFLYPLTEKTPDVYKFPDFGLYPNEQLIFTRDKKGRATKVEAANVVFQRRTLDGEDGATFRIKPLRPIDELRREALAAKPPKEAGKFRKPELVELIKLDPTIKLDLRYATTNNFLSTPFYTSAKAYLQKPAAEALVRVHKKLAEQGYGLLIHDGYRPWHVTKMFWDATPDKQKIFVANPEQGSRHNRGCAVDLTLYERKTGKAVDMVSGFDEMSDRSYPDYLGGTSLQRWHRDLLRRAMEAEGFTVYEAEWWHFDYRDWRAYPILNLTFEELPGSE